MHQLSRSASRHQQEIHERPLTMPRVTFRNQCGSLLPLVRLRLPVSVCAGERHPLEHTLHIRQLFSQNYPPETDVTCNT